MSKRIIGLDVARALAIIGMIIVNFKVVFGQHGSPWLATLTSFLDGKAAAIFVVLAGIGLALMTRSALLSSDPAKLPQSVWRIVKRAVFLFVLGLSWMEIWPADILHFYGLYMLVALLFIRYSSRVVLSGTVLLILMYPLLFLVLSYESGWDFSTLTYLDFWTVTGFLRNLFFNGFHPVLPWAAFLLFGLWYGRQDLHNIRFLKQALWWGSSVFILTQLLSLGLTQFLAQDPALSPANVEALVGTSPMPPLPLYMLNGLSIATVVISACILLTRRYPNHYVLQALHQTGKLALTFYAAHILVGMGLVEILGTGALGTYSIYFSVAYALVFSLLCLVFANVWLVYKKSGPLEWVMRWMTD